MDLPEKSVYTVSKLTEKIRSLLEGEFPSVWVRGEISNLHRAPSGHYYLSLKDSSSQIRCALFRNQARYLRFQLEDGMEVLVWGKVSVYSSRGEYQLILDTVEPLGQGGLMLAYEQLKAKLAAEGLFDAAKKRRLPFLPRRVGLVTSPTGAAVRDMIRVASRRWSGVNLLLSPTLVQGDKAPEEIVAALERLARVPDVDVIVIGRGGGSIEDLWAFNHEAVVRAVAACPVPVVSAVGHETDYTLTDFAADVRASTPSAAMEIVVLDRRSTEDALGQFHSRLRSAMLRKLDENSALVDEMRKRLGDPRRSLNDHRQRVDELVMRLANALNNKVEGLRRDAQSLALSRLRPERLLRLMGNAQDEVSDCASRLMREWRRTLDRKKAELTAAADRLEALSPLSVLRRGYAVAQRAEDGTVITDEAAVNLGDNVRVRLNRGVIGCVVTEKSPG
jgi:exodeoxyribonuclease VII large subunit